MRCIATTSASARSYVSSRPLNAGSRASGVARYQTFHSSTAIGMGGVGRRLQRQRARQALDRGQPVLDELGDREVGRQVTGLVAHVPVDREVVDVVGGLLEEQLDALDGVAPSQYETADAMSLMLGSAQRMTLANSR